MEQVSRKLAEDGKVAFRVRKGVRLGSLLPSYMDHPEVVTLYSGIEMGNIP